MMASKLTVLKERSRVKPYASAPVPTEFGEFDVEVYADRDGEEHLAIVKGRIRGAEDVLVRVHSECFTGEVLRSRKCDCREQLETAMRLIDQAGRGAIIYLRQEGRGIGLGNKIKAYALQRQGADTVEANEKLGFAADLRKYDLAADILKNLGVRSIALMTNNPHKISSLQAAGILVARRVPLEIAPTPESIDYLRTKRDRLGHLLTFKD